MLQEGHQIFLNYCYGHPESSLLLFPYSPAINYVNHHYTKYNAELRWSNHASHKTEWLKMAPRELAVLDHTGLLMDMVAIRDIEVGEEVYLNYGKHPKRNAVIMMAPVVSSDLSTRRRRLGEAVE